MNLKEEFPSKGKFYSSLTGKKFTDKEYEHVYNVWHKFEIKTMKDYHDSYLKCDVLSFADLFENFRNNSLNNYGLCLSNYLSAPGLSWDAMLKTTKVEFLNLFQILTHKYSLKKVQEVEFRIFLVDTIKPTINI